MRPSTKAAITRLEKAVRAYAWRGAYGPEDQAGLENELEQAREALYRAIDRERS